MTSLERADTMDREEIAALLEQNSHQAERISELQHQLDWFKRQLFGEKSERHFSLDESRQLSLGESLEAIEPLPAEETKVEGHARRKRFSGADDSTKPRFDPSLPVREETPVPRSGGPRSKQL